MPCYKETQNEERLRDQVDFMQLTVTPASDTDDSHWREQMDSLHSEVSF